MRWGRTHPHDSSLGGAGEPAKRRECQPRSLAASSSAPAPASPWPWGSGNYADLARPWNLRYAGTLPGGVAQCQSAQDVRTALTWAPP